jgi:phosphoribosyl-ATP pyrophosphohydrolase
MTTKNQNRRSAPEAGILEELFAVIESRKGGDAATSHTARLFQSGTGEIAKKVGEEAVEVVIEGMRGGGEALADESADLLYHLLVLWADRGVAPADVWQVLADRFGTSGIAEKASRKKS